MLVGDHPPTKESMMVPSSDVILTIRVSMTRMTSRVLFLRSLMFLQDTQSGYLPVNPLHSSKESSLIINSSVRDILSV